MTTEVVDGYTYVRVMPPALVFVDEFGSRYSANYVLALDGHRINITTLIATAVVDGVTRMFRGIAPVMEAQYTAKILFGPRNKR